MVGAPCVMCHGSPRSRPWRSRPPHVKVGVHHQNEVAAAPATSGASVQRSASASRAARGPRMPGEPVRWGKKPRFASFRAMGSQHQEEYHPAISRNHWSSFFALSSRQTCDLSMSHSRWRSWRGRAGLGSLPGAPGLGLGRAMGLRRAFGGVEAHARECRSIGASVSGRHNSHSHLAITPHFHADGREVPSWCPAFAITTRPTSCGGGGDTTKGRPTARAPCAIASACARWRANARQPARRSTA